MRPGRPHESRRGAGRVHVSIRAPTVRPGRPDTDNSSDTHTPFQSAPRPCGRGDSFGTNIIWRAPPVSIRAPTARPGRHKYFLALAPANEFQSAPRPRGRGDMFAVSGSLHKPWVSIRAPTARPGRQARIATDAAWNKFQSAPRPRGRGDHEDEMGARADKRFNPRPDRAAGATPEAAVGGIPLHVSIRAPTARPGRLEIERAASSDITGFNPRPDRAAGATRHRSLRQQELKRFNPRPDRAAGATSSSARFNASIFVSIRAPTVRPGRPTYGRNKGGAYASFNPRPDRAAGATHRCVQPVAEVKVSIRAPTVRPGRHRRSRQHLSIGIVSIRAPTVRPGRPAALDASESVVSFQSAPRPCGRGDLSAVFTVNVNTSFNPRPDRAAGATDEHGHGHGHGHGHELVSIRAPTVRPGRPASFRVLGANQSFQSAPRPCGRGDLSRDASCCARMRFNPRPDRAAGATSWNTSCTCAYRVSIRAPTVRPGRQKTRE